MRMNKPVSRFINSVAKSAALTLLCLLAARILPGQTVLDNYVQEGLRGNLALQRKRLNLQESIEALNEARGRFFPSLSFQARYTRAGGGRQMEIPVGEILNPLLGTDLDPVYLSTLPEKEQETKLSLVQPLFVPRLYFNYKIHVDRSRIQEAETAVFRRMLIAEIKQSYFNYLKAVNVVRVYERSEELLQENLRVSERLSAGGAATEEAVLQAKAEIARLRKSKSEAEKNRRLAVSYFNFLLRRPLDSPIEAVDPAELELDSELSRQEAETLALLRREDLRMLAGSISAQKNAVRLARSSNLPEVSAAVEYGIVGETYRFSGDEDFWTASLLLEWQLFSGLQNRARVSQALLRERELESRLEELREQIRLEVKEAYEDLEVARHSIEAAAEVLASSRKYFDIVAKKYEQGMSTQAEFLDARTQLTAAEIDMLIDRYDYLGKQARFESVIALGGREAGPRSPDNESIKGETKDE